MISLLICDGLIVLSVATCLYLALYWILAPTKRRVVRIAAIPTTVLLIVTGFCARAEYRAHMDELMAIAAGHGQVEEVRALLDRGASPDSWNIDYVSPALVSAAAGGHTRVVELLLERGADVNLRDGAQQSALQRARGAGHGDVVALLIRSGAQD